MNSSAKIRQVDYKADEDSIRSVRFEVFVDEQGVPAEIEMDERDAHCIHFLAQVDHKNVGTARIDIDLDGKVGRLAVLEKYRGRGIGRDLMESCHRLAEGHGLPTVWCHAQVAAVPFYLSLGYLIEGEEFEEAGIPHRKMTKRLRHAPA